MFGKIVGTLNNNCIRVINTSKSVELSLINIHVIFSKDYSKIVGVIQNISQEYIDILIIGEIVNDKFLIGDIKKPSLDSRCRLILKNELESILGTQNLYDRERLLIGNSEIYNNINVTVDKNSFFSSNFAILGNTGSGKSCGLARILQNNFYYNSNLKPVNAHFVIFDAYGDHRNAFENFNNIDGLNFKRIAFESNDNDVESIKIPSYFLDVEDLAILLDINTPELLPTIENTLRIAYIFTSKDNMGLEYQNNIIARSLLEILSSGKTPTQIRDQIIAVLSKFSTKDLNLDTIISQPGYDRTLRQCLSIDNQGKINAMNLIVELLSKYVNKEFDNMDIEPGFIYTLDDLYEALEFSLINEGILSSTVSFDKLNILRVRLRAIINSNLRKIFDFDKVVTPQEYVERFFKNEKGNNCQIVDLNFGNLDDRNSKIISKILSKLFFSFVTKLSIRGSYPIHIIIEEAHRYVQNDKDINILGYNIFERIAKEGRKYGILLGLVTQRPVELSKTVLSQCSNYIVYKMIYPDDLDVVMSLSTNITSSLRDRLKVFHPGMALCFGTSFVMPVIVRFSLPNPLPTSESIKVTRLWY